MGGGGAHFGGGGHDFGGHDHGHDGDHWHGGHGYGYGGWGYGGAFLGGLGLGYALDPYDDGAYYDDPGQCVGPQQVWDPATGQYVVQDVPYAC